MFQINLCIQTDQLSCIARTTHGYDGYVLDIVLPYFNAITHWFIHSDCSQQPHNVGMSELSHDGCFLEECGLLFVS